MVAVPAFSCVPLQVGVYCTVEELTAEIPKAVLQTSSAKPRVGASFLKGLDLRVSGFAIDLSSSRLTGRGVDWIAALMAATNPGMRDSLLGR